MSQIIFCSVTTRKQIPNLICLIKSLQSIGIETRFVAFTINISGIELRKLSAVYPQIQWINHKTLFTWRQKLKILIRRIKQGNNRFLVGMVKPAGILYLLKNTSLPVIYADPTIVFYRKPERLINEICNGNLALIPNWFDLNPLQFDEFRKHFQHGFYTSSLIGFPKNSTELVSWWHRICLFACEFNEQKVFYYEQAYLDFLPIMNENVTIIKDQDQLAHAPNNRLFMTRGLDQFVSVNYTNDVLDLLKLSKPDAGTIYQNMIKSFSEQDGNL